MGSGRTSDSRYSTAPESLTGAKIVQVSVKLFGALRQFLPAGSEFNACRLSVDDGARLIDILQQLPIPADKPYLVLLNDSKLDKHLYAETKISASDEIVLLPPIKGG